MSTSINWNEYTDLDIVANKEANFAINSDFNFYVYLSGCDAKTYLMSHKYPEEKLDGLTYNYEADLFKHLVLCRYNENKKLTVIGIDIDKEELYSEIIQKLVERLKSKSTTAEIKYKSKLNLFKK